MWEVDECPQCGGYWLDAGELALIRQECESEQERKKAVDRAFAEVAASQLASMRAGGQDQAERARVGRTLSFQQSDSLSGQPWMRTGRRILAAP